MNIILAFIILVLNQAPQLPQHHPYADEYRAEWQKAYADWKPGPKVAAILIKLSGDEAELNKAHFEGDITLEHRNVEAQRIAIHRHLLKCLGFAASPKDEAFDLIVIRTTKDELMRVFPLGKLPEKELTPNQIYPTEPGGARKVRYLTIYRWDKGEKFAVFAREK